jgi:hypothetical protein
MPVKDRLSAALEDRTVAPCVVHGVTVGPDRMAARQALVEALSDAETEV